MTVFSPSQFTHIHTKTTLNTKAAISDILHRPLSQCERELRGEANVTGSVVQYFSVMNEK